MKTSRSIPLLLLGIQTSLFAAENATLVATADTSLREYSLYANQPLGTNPNLFAGISGDTANFAKNFALLKFNPAAQIPVSAIITSASLTLTINRSSVFGDDTVFHLRRVLKNWSETTATWNNPGPGWSAAGGVIGSDYANIVTAARTVFLSDASASFNSATQLVADVQFWLNAPSANFGWVLLAADENIPHSAHSFNSREHLAPVPTLQVTFLVPPHIDQIEIISGQVRLHFPTRAGYSYAVERRAAANLGSWTMVTNFSTVVANTNTVVADTLQTGQRFYRVNVQ